MNLTLNRGFRFLEMASSRTQWDHQAILGNARTLQFMGEVAEARELLKGRYVAVLAEPDGSGDADLFLEAARGLGAQVAEIRAELWPTLPHEEIRQMAALLGRLYAAVECQGAFRLLVPMIEKAACISVYDHVASPEHPTARIVALLEGDAPVEKKRRLVLQAVLLGTIP
jgi:ornithine carbamoyltransferase